MISVSTAWNGLTSTDGFALVNEIKSTGVNTLELGFSLSEKKLSEIFEAKNNGDISISSVHNFCPVPLEFPVDSFMPDSFSLASLKANERKKAVELIKLAWGDNCVSHNFHQQEFGINLRETKTP